MLNHALHSITPDITVNGSAGAVVRTLRLLRHPDDPGNHPARILISRTVNHPAARSVLFYGARPLQDGVADACTILTLAGQAVALHTADGDRSLTLNDATGRPLWARSAQGTINTWRYDAQSGRALSLSEQARGGTARLRERYEYGADEAALRARNLAGALTVTRDNAGISEVLSLSLTGQPLRAQQRLLAGAQLPDWSREPPLEAALETTARGDASGAPLTQTNAAGVSTLSRYDISGTLAETCLRWRQNGQQKQALTLSGVVRAADGRVLTQQSGNGVLETYGYDPHTLRLRRHTVARPAGHPLGAALLSDLHYGYDPAGNIVSLDDAAVTTRWHANRRVSGTRTYGYDSLYRLVSATGRERAAGGEWSPYRETYHYDDGDNLLKTVHGGQQGWTRQMAISARSNRAVLVAPGAEAGQVNPEDHFLPGGLQKTLADGRALSWLADGQLGGVSPVVRAGGADDTERYRYSDGGSRVRKVRSTAVSGGWQSATVTRAGGCETRQRSGPGGGVQLDVVMTEAGSVRLVENRLNGEVHLRYAFADQQGSVGCETDGSGSVTSREEYYPYGGSAGSDEEATEVMDRTRRYSGKERDASGLIYYGWRYYQPEAGRWLSADPGGLIDGVNLYRMCRNNPVTLCDSKGLFAENLYSVMAIAAVAALAYFIFNYRPRELQSVSNPAVISKWDPAAISNDHIITHMVRGDHSDFYEKPAEEVLASRDVFSASLIDTRQVDEKPGGSGHRYTGAYAETGFIIQPPPQNIIATHEQDISFPTHIGKEGVGGKVTQSYLLANTLTRPPLAGYSFTGKPFPRVTSYINMLSPEELLARKGEAEKILPDPTTYRNEILIAGKEGVRIHESYPPTEKIPVKGILIASKYRDGRITPQAKSRVERLREVNPHLPVFQLTNKELKPVATKIKRH